MEFQHELIIPNEGLPFKIFLFEGGHGNYEREKHWHTSIEIFAVLKGRLTFFLNEEEYAVSRETFFSSFFSFCRFSIETDRKCDILK